MTDVRRPLPVHIMRAWRSRKGDAEADLPRDVAPPVAVLFAVLVLKTPPGRWLFDQLNTVVMKLLGYTNDGSRFLFGSLLDRGRGHAVHDGVGRGLTVREEREQERRRHEPV